MEEGEQREEGERNAARTALALCRLLIRYLLFSQHAIFLH
jgi:hypothetical protein